MAAIQEMGASCLLATQGFALRAALFLLLAFGLIFPFAAACGFGYGHEYKKGTIFQFAFLPDSDAGQVLISIQMPTGTNLEATGEVVKEVERRVAGHPDVKYAISTIGQSGGGAFGGGSVGSNYAQIQLTLYDKRTIGDRFGKPKEHLRDRSSNSISAELLQKVGRIPGAFIKVSATLLVICSCVVKRWAW